MILYICIWLIFTTGKTWLVIKNVIVLNLNLYPYLFHEWAEINVYFILYSALSLGRKRSAGSKTERFTKTRVREFVL